MLLSLEVHNYSIIDHVHMEFDKGFNVITGETGAGKSILLGALGLILGDRADTRILFDQNRKCTVEATFEIPKSLLNNLDNPEDFTLREITSLKREISGSGKTKAFINDVAVKLSTLRDLAKQLIDIHNQFDTLYISQPSYQLIAIDAFAGNQKVLDVYQQSFLEYNTINIELQKTIKAKDSIERDYEYYAFQLKELDKLPLDTINKEELTNELNALENAEGIRTLMQNMTAVLTGDDYSIESRLIDLNKSLSRYADINYDLGLLSDMIEEMLNHCSTADRLSSKILDQVDTSEERLQELQELLDEINRLEKKHGLSDFAHLVKLQDELRMKTSGKENLDQLITEKKKQLSKAKETMSTAADTLTASRKDVIPTLSEKISEKLRELAILHGRVAFDAKKAEQYTESGNDDIVMLFAANLGQNLLPVDGVASGGELSRLALSMKSIIADRLDVPTLLFDEIDAGISGAVAFRLGHILNTLAENRQVICITHSPQVASMPGRHFNVSKMDKIDRTITLVKTLNTEERIIEIAKMLSADPPSESALTNARELLMG